MTSLKCLEVWHDFSHSERNNKKCYNFLNLMSFSELTAFLLVPKNSIVALLWLRSWMVTSREDASLPPSTGFFWNPAILNNCVDIAGYSWYRNGICRYNVIILILRLSGYIIFWGQLLHLVNNNYWLYYNIIHWFLSHNIQ